MNIILETRRVKPDELRTEEEVLSTIGFAGHTIDKYPEPARSWYIAYYKLEKVFPSAPTPLLVFCRSSSGSDDELLGVTNYVWTTRVGVVPLKRRDATHVEMDQAMRVVSHYDVANLVFSTSEILVTLPPYLVRRNTDVNQVAFN